MNHALNEYHRFLTKPWSAMGQSMPDGAGCNSGLMVNETATRARAGMLNIVSAVTIFMLLAAPELDPVIYVGPFVIFDMVMAAIFGLTPLSPLGNIATLITMKTAPLWKPNQPKRFAWILGASMGVICLLLRLLHVDVSWLIVVLGTCFALTWLEAVMGFCVGCWMYSLFFKCEVCKLP